MKIRKRAGSSWGGRRWHLRHSPPRAHSRCAGRTTGLRLHRTSVPRFERVRLASLQGRAQWPEACRCLTRLPVVRRAAMLCREALCGRGDRHGPPDVPDAASGVQVGVGERRVAAFGTTRSPATGHSCGTTSAPRDPQACSPTPGTRSRWAAERHCRRPPLSPRGCARPVTSRAIGSRNGLWRDWRNSVDKRDWRNSVDKVVELVQTDQAGAHDPICPIGVSSQ